MGRTLRWALSIALGVLSLWLLLRALDLAIIGAAWRRAQLGYLLATVPLLTISYACRGRRWAGLFERAPSHATGILLIGFLLNNVLPARAGEVARVVLMQRENRFAPSTTVATLMVERAFDGLAIALLMFGALLGRAHWQLAWARHGAFVLLALAPAMFLVAFWRERFLGLAERLLANVRFGKPVLRIARTLLQSLAVVASPRALGRALSLTALEWCFELLAYASVALAFGATMSMAKLALFVAVVNLSSLAPTPGGVGAIEFFATLALAGDGIGKEDAFVIVSALHAVQVAFCLIAGGAYALYLGQFSRDSSAPQTASKRARAS